MKFNTYKKLAYKRAKADKFPKERFIDLVASKFPEYHRSYIQNMFYEMKREEEHAK